MTRKTLLGFLYGIKIIDFTQVLSGPYCTQLLADLGATVVKVEPPSGDSTREWGPPFINGQSAYFLSLNRNKRSLALDLSRKPKATEVALRIAKESDVLVENFRPGVMQKLGLGFDVIKKVNPRIVYCSISGYGQTGPLSHKPGYDIAAFAASGLMSITGEEHGEPVKVGVPVADIGAGMFGAIAIASALAGRASEAKVRPVYLDISMYDSMISWLTFQAGIFFATGENPKRLGSAHPLLVPYQAFKAKDRHFILAVGNDAIWIRVCEAIGAEDLANDTRFKTVSARVVNREKLIPILDRIFEKENSDHWLSLFDQAGVPCSPIASVGEALWSNHSKRRRLVMNLRQTGGNIVRSISSPITFNNGKKIRSRNFAPPSLGENSREVLLSFGFSKREIGELQEQQIVPKVK